MRRPLDGPDLVAWDLDTRELAGAAARIRSGAAHPSSGETLYLNDPVALSIPKQMLARLHADGSAVAQTGTQ